MGNDGMKKHLIIVILALAVLTIATYWRVAGNEFISYDDDIYVYGNHHVQEGITPKSLKWAFNIGFASNWHPLTWISHMVDCRLFGPKPMGHHLVNVVFHVLNTALLMLVLMRMTGSLRRSAFVAGLFAVHPLHVESVAWIAERKDVLSAFFWLLTMGAYVLYSEKPSIKRYVPVIVLFALGLMAKPMLVTLPFVLLLLDYWPLKRDRRWPRLVLEKTPLLVLSAASCVLTFIAQSRGGAVGKFDVYPAGIRIANAMVGYTAYLWKMIWPAKLAILYPHPGDTLPIWKAAVSAVLLIAVSGLVFYFRRKRPYLAVGWLWFLGTLVPVIGLVQVGHQAIADRYTYLPLVGLFIMIAWSTSDLTSKKGRKGEGEMLFSIACLAIIVLAAMTYTQLGYWKTSRSLFEHALACTSRNYVMEDSLGQALAREQNYADAARHHEAALKIQPDYAPAHCNLAIILANEGKLNEAVAHFRKAMQFSPREPMMHFNLAVALEMQGKIEEAVAEYRTCAAGKPDNAIVYYNLGVALEKLGRLGEAADEYRWALEIDPQFDQAIVGLQRVEKWRLGKH